MTSMQAFLLEYRSSQRALFGCFRVAARARKGKRLRVIAARAASYTKLCSIQKDEKNEASID